MLDSEETILRMMEGGAMRYLIKDAGRDQILADVDAALSGKPFFCDTSAPFQPNASSFGKKTERQIDFTARELQIITLMSEQCSSAEIAQRVFLSEKTADGHRYNIMQKIGCKKAVGIVLYAVKHGIVTM